MGSIVCGHKREGVVLCDGYDTEQARGAGLQFRVNNARHFDSGNGEQGVRISGEKM